MYKSYIKLLFVLLVLCIGTYISYYVNGNFTSGIDDANIYAVYMRNFAHGHGFVYNIGGERVEGFTSLLWCLVGALYFFITPNAHLLLLITNMVIVTYSLWRLIVFVDNYFQDKRIITPYSLFILGCLFIFPGYFDWSVFSLMETGLWGALLTLCFLNTFRWETDINARKKLNRNLIILLVLLVFTRPESLVWGPAFLLYRIFRLYKNKTELKTWIKTSVLYSSIFIGAVLALTLWRLYYFGFPFPNTYYAKVSQDLMYNLDQGQTYIWQIICFSNPFLLFVFVALLLYILYYPKNIFGQNSIIIPLVFSILITVFIPLYTGGDHFFLGRLVQPTLPVIYFAFTVFFVQLINRKLAVAWKEFSLVLIVLAVFFVMPARDRLRDAIRNKYGGIAGEFLIAKGNRQFGIQLTDFFKDADRYPKQGVLCAGALAFHYKGETMDMLGLNNVVMAHADSKKTRDLLKGHASFNKTVFYQQKPDLIWIDTWFEPMGDTLGYIIPENRPEYEFNLTNIVYKKLLYDEEFRTKYVPIAIFKEGYDSWLFAHVNKDFLPVLSKPPYSYKIFPRE